jgi:hypothetical protein
VQPVGGLVLMVPQADDLLVSLGLPIPFKVLGLHNPKDDLSGFQPWLHLRPI